MRVNIIAAVASNGAIGRDNALLWHLRADMKFFRQTTVGHPVIMGRRTFESVGRALPGRLNIVVSRGELQLPGEVVLAHSLEEALQLAAEGCARTDAECFVMGGAQIYSQAMPIADKLFITRVFCSPEDADAFFPDIDGDIWHRASAGDVMQDEESGLKYSFEEYVKN